MNRRRDAPVFCLFHAAWKGFAARGTCGTPPPRPDRELSSLDLPGLFAVIVFFYEAKDFFDRFIKNSRDIHCEL